MYSNNESGGNALSSHTIILSVYLTTHLEFRVIQRQMTGRLVANKLEIVEKRLLP